MCTKLGQILQEFSPEGRSRASERRPRCAPRRQELHHERHAVHELVVLRVQRVLEVRKRESVHVQAPDQVREVRRLGREEQRGKLFSVYGALELEFSSALGRFGCPSAF